MPPDDLDDIDTLSLAAALQILSPDTEYARGVTDLLKLLGLARRGDTGSWLVPTGEVARMVLESLMAHLVDGVTVGFAWEDLGAAQLRGVDFLRAVEQARAAAVPEPTPGRVVSVVQAVFKARLGSQDAYLMQYDEHAGRYQPIGGKVDFGDADSADALRREMMEELRLKAIPSRYDCPLEPVLTGWFTTEISATYGVLTAYTVDFYAATSVRFFIDTDINTRWLTRDEIAAGRAADGRAITTIYQQALGFDLLDAIPPALTLTRR